MRYVVITGANRGLGEALVNQFKDDHVIAITRTTTENKNIDKQYTCDLSNEGSVQHVVDELKRDYKLDDSDEILLINNAGTVKPVSRSENTCIEGYMTSYKTNTLAPIILSTGFVDWLRNSKCKKKIVNISSGAAINAVSGWSAYCSSKAALNMFTDVMRLEQENEQYGVKVVTFRPGVIDTDMQLEIRSSKKEDFEDLERFKAMKDNEQLLSADQVAGALTNLIDSEDFGQVAHTTVQDYL
ncbi:(S)-benzoin forming benzil reductase [Aliicoccus persicus]|uniref:Benzil reductase ((S)-benzoin forming) n=1 Tax=Aliicoccus persicus TaxID=930138 RepID=A0A662Z2I4_9STAP|nr:(S)-benzoin forming benzil reductase [Aliicoccus persicus]SEV94040.1 benzil reductase ((S)-benzoin forming) [Aliicoccus persicus]